MSVAADGAVETVPVVAAMFKNVPFRAVVAPMVMLSIVPTLVGATSIDPVPLGFMWTWPVPVGLMSICAFDPFMLVETLTEMLSPPPAPMLI